MAISEQDKEEMLAEIFDDQKINRVRFFCAKHAYQGPVKGQPEITPGLGCADCWKIFYLVELATTPPSERKEKLEELEEVLHKAVALFEANKWDIEMYPHAQIEIGNE
jgi:hypothetical protein